MEHRLEEFIARMELVLHESIAQCQLVLGNPRDSMDSVNRENATTGGVRTRTFFGSPLCHLSTTPSTPPCPFPHFWPLPLQIVAMCRSVRLPSSARFHLLLDFGPQIHTLLVSLPSLSKSLINPLVFRSGHVRHPNARAGKCRETVQGSTEGWSNVQSIRLFID